MIDRRGFTPYNIVEDNEVYLTNYPFTVEESVILRRYVPYDMMTQKHYVSKLQGDLPCGEKSVEVILPPSARDSSHTGEIGISDAPVLPDDNSPHKIHD